ncbi:MAG: acyl-CoA thioesterase [Oligoflexia bacterium]|nr:acyl-CoA thioesterase [Oligoflexia bacterium]
MTQLVLPQYTNALGTVFGGQIAAWIDICAAVSAQRYSRGIVVTASIDKIDFLAPVKLGMIVILRSKVNMAWRTSMEIGVRIEAEDPRVGVRKQCTSSYLTFVALDEQGKPRPVLPFDPGSDPDCIRRARQAQHRRDARLRLRQARIEDRG